ncbi:MAG: AAA family ATPase [Methylococcales bacterium]|nr:AAA family ATPase [Methylococcales bacterium]
MYLQYFGLNQQPFNITPNPDFLYLSEKHQEAYAHLNYGIQQGNGFVAITGEVGTGKTTLCRYVLNQLPDNINIALIFNPRLSAIELLASICDELDIISDADNLSIKVLTDALNQQLLKNYAEGKRTILLIDEAQSLSVEVLEQIRLLSNLETNQAKLLLIFLVGQPELQDLLQRNDLRQLSQRITARYHLEKLSLEETIHYIHHRIHVSGVDRPLFNRQSIKQIFKLSAGTPRIINIICDRALMGAYVEEKAMVDQSIVKKAANEVLGTNKTVKVSTFLYASLSVILVIVFLLIFNKLSGIPFVFDSPVTVEINDKVVIEKQAEEIVESVKKIKPVNINKVVKAELSSSSTQTKLMPLRYKAELSSSSTQTKLMPLQHKKPVAVIISSQNNKEINDVKQHKFIFKDWLKSLPNNSTQLAFNQLFLNWQAIYKINNLKTPCVQALEQNLSCIFNEGNWNKIKQINRPVLIKLIHQNGNESYLYVKSVGEKMVEIIMNNHPFSFPKYEIEPYWLGEFLVLWKAPVIQSIPLKLGLNSESVIWLRKQFDLIDKKDVKNKDYSQIFDDKLKQIVMIFQKQHHLKPDGIVGKNTLFQIEMLVNQTNEEKINE